MTIKEDHGHAPTVDHGKIDVSSPEVRSRINAALSASLCAHNCVTPYVALEKMRKVLVNWSIFIPGVTFLEGNEGSHIFEVHQFGFKLGQHENGQIITQDDVEYEIEFKWLELGGGYNCTAKIREVGEDTN